MASATAIIDVAGTPRGSITGDYAVSVAPDGKIALSVAASVDSVTLMLPPVGAAELVRLISQALALALAPVEGAPA